MTEIESLQQALRLAREDLWFLMNYCDIPEIYRKRCCGTAEFITRTLNDRNTFDPIKFRWFKEATQNLGYGNASALADAQMLGRDDSYFKPLDKY